jgi:outer membrane protein assembly factor BamB
VVRLAWAGLAATMALPLSAADWPQWRGPHRDGISAETGLLEAWPSQGPKLLFEVSGAGEGYSTVSVSRGRVFTMGAGGGSEFVAAFDEATGKRLWRTAHGKAYRDSRGNGPRGTPTVDGDRLYALGAMGDLSCLETATGRMVWTLNILDRFSGTNPKWGLSESPLVLKDRVLVNPGGPGASVVALRKADGSLLWKSGSDPAGYSSAVLWPGAGGEQAVFFTAKQALGLRPSDGRVLWDYARVANRTANVATPLVVGNRVFLSSDYGTGAALLERAADGSSVREVYFTKQMRNHWSSVVRVGEHVYGFSGSVLTALRLGDGVRAWRDRSVGKGSLVYADGHLYLLSERGDVALVEATPTAYREKARFRIETGSLPTYGPPVIANGRLYLRDQDTLYVFDVGGGR